ncbi:hypothetical protein WKW77_12150 [Variovorax ureilyticus]|uniref:Uncharacterized protein n=1 Tax=Variovorax ureilyticus TaxID=1836198 RepID=A0ABU8VDS7_9BURK
MLTWTNPGERQSALNAAIYLNPLAAAGSPDDKSDLVALRETDMVQEAARQAAYSVSQIWATHGQMLAISEAVRRVGEAGDDPTPWRIEQELQDLLGEAVVMAEDVRAAGRIEERVVGAFKSMRAPHEWAVRQRIDHIKALAFEKGATEQMADEIAGLQDWLDEPWRDPDELRDLSHWFAEAHADGTGDAAQAKGAEGEEAREKAQASWKSQGRHVAARR